MEKNKNNQKQEATALERYKIISPILAAVSESADEGRISQLKTEACVNAGVSRKTISRWVDCYVQNGFEGLKHKNTENPTKRKISGELVDVLPTPTRITKLFVRRRGLPQIS